MLHLMVRIIKAANSLAACLIVTISAAAGRKKAAHLINDESQITDFNGHTTGL